MIDKTIALIYALKQNPHQKTSSIDIAVDFYACCSGNDPKTYSYNTLFVLIKNAFLDYISTADDPRQDMYTYFRSMEIMDTMTDVKDDRNYIFYSLHGMLSALHMAIVRNKKGEYINGFKELKIQDIIPDFNANKNIPPLL